MDSFIINSMESHLNKYKLPHMIIHVNDDEIDNVIRQIKLRMRGMPYIYSSHMANHFNAPQIFSFSL